MKNSINLLNQEIEKQMHFVFTTHKNSPFCDCLDVIENREKAIKVKHPNNNMTVWIPKSAFIDCGMEIPAFTLSQWFRQKMIRENNNYVFRALEMIGW